MTLHESNHIYQTTNYSLFKTSKKNRPVEGCKVLNSIKHKNLLAEKPILVTKKMLVLDGQHRLRAAQLLNLPIYYQIAREEITDSDLAILNTQKAWTALDYLNLHKWDDPNYKFLHYLCENYAFTHYLAFVIDCTGLGKKIRRDFQQGRFKLKDTKENTEKSIRQVAECRDAIKCRVGARKMVTANCLLAIYQLVHQDFYDHLKFIKKINSNFCKDDLYNALEYRKVNVLYENLKALYFKGSKFTGIARAYHEE